MLRYLLYMVEQHMRHRYASSTVSEQQECRHAHTKHSATLRDAPLFGSLRTGSVWVDFSHRHGNCLRHRHGRLPRLWHGNRLRHRHGRLPRLWHGNRLRDRHGRLPRLWHGHCHALHICAGLLRVTRDLRVGRCLRVAASLVRIRGRGRGRGRVRRRRRRRRRRRPGRPPSVASAWKQVETRLVVGACAIGTYCRNQARYDWSVRPKEAADWPSYGRSLGRHEA